MCVRLSTGAKIGAQLAASAHEQSASKHVLQFVCKDSSHLFLRFVSGGCVVFSFFVEE
jgi:hypothetical protein